jgi:hypothetical protein
MVRKFMTYNNGVNVYTQIVHIFNAGFDDVPLLTEMFVEIGLRTSEPWIDDNIKQFVSRRGEWQLK